MGRWAEVYFTSPPEKREEAVLDLLRELQARNPEQSTLSEPAQSSPSAETELLPPDVGSVTQRRLEMQRCHTCGQDNPVRHQFCGMCGGKLGSPASDDYRATEDQYRSPAVGSEHAFNPGYAEPRGLDRQPAIEQSAVTTEEPARDLYDLSLFQSLREKEVPADFGYRQSPSVRYRYYIGAILAVLIVALGYMGWRSGLPNQDAQSTPPPPAPVATDSTPPANQNTAGSAPSNPPNNAEPQAAPPEQRPVEPPVAKSAPAPERTQTMPSEHGRVPSPAPGATPQPVSFGQQNAEASGAEDFVVAQKYLSGTNGQGRDGAEAAKWLWKSMGKHYGPAMVALADLYLKGDGVPKNCDQARVLLDSAALRGVAGAGQRLRNLQAFGCQ
jgi:hypothetical protein